jgi:hypothetical protein
MRVNHARNILGQKLRLLGKEQLVNQLRRVVAGDVTTQDLLRVLAIHELYDTLTLFDGDGLPGAAIGKSATS